MRYAYLIRAVLGVLFAAAAFVTAVAAHAAVAVPDGKSFLEQLDARRFDEAYARLSVAFTADYDLARFRDEQQRLRERLGPASCRLKVMEQPLGATAADGQPEGFLLRYRTQFASGTSMETIKFLRDPGGAYRVAGYMQWPVEAGEEPCARQRVAPREAAATDTPSA